MKEIADPGAPMLDPFGGSVVISEAVWVLGFWAIAQFFRALPRIIWAIRCPARSNRYICPPPGDAPTAKLAHRPRPAAR